MVSASNLRNLLAKRIAGEIVLSDEPGVLMKRWRETFSTSQTRLARKIGISLSVVSDYESGRRNNPGVKFIKKYIEALLEINEKSSADLFKKLAEPSTFSEHGIIQIEEFAAPISIKHFSRAISGRILACGNSSRSVNGYTLLDSQIIIAELPGWKYLEMFGETSERALIFTNIELQLAPMMSLRFSPVKPCALVYHGVSPTDMDVKIAENENVALIYSRAIDLEYLSRSLRKLSRTIENKKK